MMRGRILNVAAACCACLVLALLAASSAPASSWFDMGTDKDVPYVPTSPEIVDRMLEMAEVGSGDLLYDLGSGDGRIVITAAKEYGARGVGIDIDPSLVSESQANAREEGVAERVTFKEANLFETDISEATAVTMYLLQAVNLRLRPKLISELRPGTRVVSHAFDLGEWEPDATVYEGASVLYKWVVPANVSGVWRLSGSGLPQGFELRLDQEFQQVSGNVHGSGPEQAVRGARLVGAELAFTAEVHRDGRAQPMSFRGMVNGDVMEGTAAPESGGQAQPWRASREPGTAKPIDAGASG